jgi:hypothetical protein
LRFSDVRRASSYYLIVPVGLLLRSDGGSGAAGRPFHRPVTFKRRAAMTSPEKRQKQGFLQIAETLATKLGCRKGLHSIDVAPIAVAKSFDM